jgi:hypothetical protein
MIVKNLISGVEMEITTRVNAGKYEIMQETVRQTAFNWKPSKNKAEKLKQVRILETYARRFGLQKELREAGII